MSVKVLFVIDGAFQFQSSPTTNFTFNALVSTLQGAGFQVTLANRETVTDTSGAISNFNFATSVDLLDFEVIWMIGDGGLNINSKGTTVVEGQAGQLDSAQLNAIANFMELGGGVFAVGDHYGLGADMCGQIPRVRVMRSWYGDTTRGAPPPNVPLNFSAYGIGRADTTLRNPAGTYPTTNASGGATVNPYAYFENQSDALPQTIVPTPPTHPILQNNGQDITVYPDHMHEGHALGDSDLPASVYLQPSPFGDTSKDEFRLIGGNRQTPKIIATGQTKAQASYDVGDIGPTALDPTVCHAFTVNTLAAYDGRAAGVGRIVTGSTFHHYLDINLTGATSVGPPAPPTTTLNDIVGGDAQQGEGLSTNPSAFEDIQAVYVNITNWLARPTPEIGLILERSTFGQDEVGATPDFPAAILVTVDGLKPSQFPGGGITTLTPSTAQLTQWAPAVSASGFPITITPTAIASDDPTLADRLQRFTFTYQLNFTGNAFTFAGTADTAPVNASLVTSAVTNPLSDQAWIELVKGANPFMLDLADGNTTSWLSSDIKVFHVVAGESFLGQTLTANATRADALAFLQSVISGMDTATFTSLDPSEDGPTSTLSVAAVTTSNPPKPVYNFALARVRISSAGGDADPVQVFFRSFVTQTTAALTYQLDASLAPTGGYVQTSGTPPIPLPGTQGGGTEWLSFPFFASPRAATPAGQTDSNNSKSVLASAGFQFYGALIDNNLDVPYLTETPVSGGGLVSLPTIVMGEHQCVVTEVIYGGAPIPSGANPATSDKISQRNLAISTVANPGMSASRVALHTFEIEATPGAITPEVPPDELLLAWAHPTPRRTYVTLHIPSWNAHDVVSLADRLYTRHDIRAIDAHTIEIPGGGDRYVPIPKSLVRQAGVLAVQLPLGIRKGQRFDLAVQQITNRQRTAKQPEPVIQKITRKEASEILQRLTSRAAKPEKAGNAESTVRGVFDLGDNRSLVTDLSIFDGGGDHALIITHPDPKLVEEARQNSGRWREPIGTFQLAIPVSTKKDMLFYHLQLLSIMLWRVEHLDRKSVWYPTMSYYLALLIEKVRALGGDPYEVPPTPGGDIPQLYEGKGGKDDCNDEDERDVVIVNIFSRGRDHKK
jgi:hypothetical protein